MNREITHAFTSDRRGSLSPELELELVSATDLRRANEILSDDALHPDADLSLGGVRVGLAYALGGPARAADVILERQLAPQPEWTPWAIYSASWALAHAGRWKKAEVIAAAIQADSPDYGDARALVGLSRFELGMFDMVAAPILESMELNPGIGAAWLATLADIASSISGRAPEPAEVWREYERLLSRLDPALRCSELAALGAVSAYRGSLEGTRTRFEEARGSTEESLDLAEISNLVEELRAGLPSDTSGREIKKWLHGFCSTL